MLNLKELNERIGELELAKKRLEAADPCPEHGKDSLEICEYCLETIGCLQCYTAHCSCQNDE